MDVAPGGVPRHTTPGPGRPPPDPDAVPRRGPREGGMMRARAVLLLAAIAVTVAAMSAPAAQAADEHDPLRPGSKAWRSATRPCPRTTAGPRRMAAARPVDRRRPRENIHVVTDPGRARRRPRRARAADLSILRQGRDRHRAKTTARDYVRKIGNGVLPRGLPRRLRPGGLGADRDPVRAARGGAGPPPAACQASLIVLRCRPSDTTIVGLPGAVIGHLNLARGPGRAT